MTLLSVPNVSEGRDPGTVAVVAEGWTGARLLDVHTDADHDRSVYTLAGERGRLAQALLAGARTVVDRVRLEDSGGVHPHVGALDVAPVVYLEEADRGAACAEALVAADLLGRELELPVFLYGALAGGRTRAELRRGGREELGRRIASGELEPDFGPGRMHPSAGAVLVAARPPLVAFNLALAPGATVEQARDVAARIREGGPEGLRGVRAIGLELHEAGLVQVSTNVEDHRATALAEVVAAVRRHTPVAAAELVGLAPAAALEGFPEDVPIPGFDPSRHLLEHALAP